VSKDWTLPYTPCLKKVPPLACYNFDTCERISIFFHRNVSDKVSNQTTLYGATSNNLCFCSTWQNGETCKLHFFSLKCCISAVPEFNQLLDFFDLFDSRLILTLLYMTPSCNQCVRPRAVGSTVQDKRSRERCRSWTVLHAQCRRLLGFLLRSRQVRWENKAPSDFLLSGCNTSAKNYRNRIAYVKTIASQRWDVFETPYRVWTLQLLWSPYVTGQTIIFLPCDFYLLSFFSFLA